VWNAKGEEPRRLLSGTDPVLPGLFQVHAV